MEILESIKPPQNRDKSLIIMKKTYVSPRIRIANVNLSDQFLASSISVSKRNSIEEEIEDVPTESSNIIAGDWNI